MADKDIVQKRKEKFSDLDRMDMAQEILDAEEAKPTKNFLGALTDLKSITRFATAGGLALAGAPGAGAALAGIDILQAPGEVEASKREKEGKVTEAKKGVMAAKDKELAEDMSEKLARMDFLTRNPIEALTLALTPEPGQVPLTNAQISEMYGFPMDANVNWYAALDDTDRREQKRQQLQFVASQIEQETDPVEKKTLMLHYLDISQGSLLTEAQKESVVDVASNNESTFEEWIDSIEHLFVPSSMIRARDYYNKTKDSLGAWNMLDGMQTAKDLSDEQIEASIAIATGIKALTEFNPDGTIKSIGSVSQAIGAIQDDRMQALARKYADDMGFIGTDRQNTALFNEIAAKLYFQQDTYNMSYPVQSGVAKPLPDDAWLRGAQLLTTESLKHLDQSVQTAIMADIGALATAVEKIGIDPNSEAGAFIRRLALKDAKEDLGKGVHSKLELHKKAVELVTAREEYYYDKVESLTRVLPAEPQLPEKDTEAE